MIYISAQPDNVYFHWQVELYLWQFSKQGIIDQCYALFGYRDQPSEYGLKLSKMYPGKILMYKDSRTDLSYIPTIRPHILAQFFKEFPELGKNVFYHDSDIFLVKIPNFEDMLNDDIGYVSDTISYIGYNYINSCYDNYKQKYDDCPNLGEEMCKIIGIDYEIVKNRDSSAGGAQYLLKNIDYTFWTEAEIMCNKLYTFLTDYDKKYKISHGIQIWTVDMWVVLWLYWKSGKSTKVVPELDFSWGTSSVDEYNKKNIFHLAGVTQSHSHNTFYKGDYTNVNVFDEYRKNKHIFDHVNANNATIEYVNAIKEYCGDVNINYEHIFALYFEDNSNLFQIYEGKKCFDKPIWKSLNGKYIIFSNKNSWIMTYNEFINEISEDCLGGIMRNTNLVPYSNDWNIPTKYLIFNDTTINHLFKF